MTNFITDNMYALMMIFFVVAMFAGLAYSENKKAECRIAALKADKSADDIQKICK